MIAPLFRRPTRIGSLSPEHSRLWHSTLNMAGVEVEPECVREYRRRVQRVEQEADDAEEAAGALTRSGLAHRIAAGETIPPREWLAVVTAPVYAEAAALAVEVVRSQWPSTLAQARPEVWEALQERHAVEVAKIVKLADSDWVISDTFDDLARKGYFDLSRDLADAIEAAGALAGIYDAVPLATGAHYPDTGAALTIWSNANFWRLQGRPDRDRYASCTRWRPSLECVQEAVSDIRDRGLVPWLPTPEQHHDALTRDGGTEPGALYRAEVRGG